MIGATTLGELANLHQSRVNSRVLVRERMRREEAERDFAWYAQMTEARLAAELRCQSRECGTRYAPKREAIVTVFQAHPSLSYRDIARATGASYSSTAKCIQRWLREEANR